MKSLFRFQLPRLSLFFLVLIFCAQVSEGKNWNKYANRQIEQNFSRSKNKIKEFLQDKYEVSPFFFSINDQIQQLRIIQSKFLGTCSATITSKCSLVGSDYLTFMRTISIQITKILSEYSNGTTYKVLKIRSLLTRAFTILQKKPTTMIDLNKTISELQAIFLQYLSLWITDKSKDHIFASLEIINTMNQKIIPMRKNRLKDLTNTINYFIRKEKETTRKQTYLRHLELINLFWNNVLKIKKDQR